MSDTQFLRCPHCTGALTFEDETCPHCGRPNDAAARHLKEKAYYHADYHETVTDAKANLRLNRHLIVASVVLALLVLTAASLSVAYKNMYDYVHEARAEQNVQQQDDLGTMLHRYLENGEYVAFRVLLNRQSIFTFRDSFTQYRQLGELTFDYYMVYREIMQLPLAGWTDAYPATCDERATFYIAQGLSDFFSHKNKDYAAEERLEEALTKKAVDEMELQLMSMMKTYFGAAEDDIEDLQTLPKDELERKLTEIWNRNH